MPGVRGRSIVCCLWPKAVNALQWCHNGRDSVSNHQPHDCLLSGLFRRRSKKTWKLRVTGLCVGNSPGTGEFPAQISSDAENVSIWWRHNGKQFLYTLIAFQVVPQIKSILQPVSLFEQTLSVMSLTGPYQALFRSQYDDIGTFIQVCYQCFIW